MCRIREALYYYYLFIYNVEEFGKENNREYFAYDESKFTTQNNELIWLLDLINTETKEFLFVSTKIIEIEKIKAFITRYIPPGNHIVTEVWYSYSWIGNLVIFGENIIMDPVTLVLPKDQLHAQKAY